jgi:type III pantothenate kinase
VILAIDIGNSRIHIGAFEARRLRADLQFSTPRALTPDEAWSMVREVDPSPEAAIIASVVPRLTRPFSEMFCNRFRIEPRLVSAELSTGLKFNYSDPSSLGADRIANAVGAYNEYRRDTIVIDFGTATTFDLVTREGEYLGGVIAPGIQLALDALIRATAQLSSVEIVVPEHCVGHTTKEALQAGIFYSVQGQIVRILDQIKAETKREYLVVATGGLAQLIAFSIPEIQRVDPLLTLKGMLEIYYQNP